MFNCEKHFVGLCLVGKGVLCYFELDLMYLNVKVW